MNLWFHESANPRVYEPLTSTVIVYVISIGTPHFGTIIMWFLEDHVHMKNSWRVIYHGKSSRTLLKTLAALGHKFQNFRTRQSQHSIQNGYACHPINSAHCLNIYPVTRAHAFGSGLLTVRFPCFDSHTLTCFCSAMWLEPPDFRCLMSTVWNIQSYQIFPPAHQ